MSERREAIPLLHMLDHAREAMILAQGRTRVDLDNDRLLELALVRLLEIVGRQPTVCPRECVPFTLRSRGPKLLHCATGLSTATTQWIWTYFGRSSSRFATTCDSPGRNLGGIQHPAGRVGILSSRFVFVSLPLSQAGGGTGNMRPRFIAAIRQE
jgi:hypothetical protein